MRFLRRNQYALLCVAVLVFSSVMALRQFERNQSAHTQRIEDFILLQERGETQAAEQLYQRLIQELPELDDKALVDDLQRTSMVTDPKTPNTDNLVWKLLVSTKNELRKRSSERLARFRRQQQDQ